MKTTLSRSWIGGALFAVATLVWSGAAPIARAEDKPKIEWQAWSDNIFEKAKAEKKLVLLDLGARWCHWCHVMEELTYSDPAVIKLIQEKYIPVHVDQDSRPDLANRYEDYGWPATIVFKWDGTELAKRQGYIPPKPMASMMQAFVDDPTPGPSVVNEEPIVAASDAALTKEQREAARKFFIKAYDTKRGGWGSVHHYLNWDALEYCLTDPDPKLVAMGVQTMKSGLKLIDHAWGGVYQYSTDGDWDHPHFEKIMPFQAENIRVFSLAASLRHEPEWLVPARKIQSFLKTFLSSPEGVFYVSQDADVVEGQHGGEFFKLNDAERRKKGIPRVDTHLYARENGLAVTGLCALYAATGDADTLSQARSAAEWIIAHRALPDGGFRHDEKDAAGPYLADSLAMGRAFLALYTVTAERPWLAKAEQTATFIDAHFRGPNGFITSAKSDGAPLTPKPQMDENIALVRFANLLHQHTGKAPYRAMAEHAMRLVASPVMVERQGFATSGMLLADRELTTEPAHVTVIGQKDDPAAQALFAAALQHAPGYARIEWLDDREGPLPRNEVELPKLPKAAAFVCANGACSLPLQTPEKVAARLDPKKK